MLNKIKIIGKVSINEKKEQDERKIDNPDFASEEVVTDFDKPQSKFGSEKENRELRFYFSLFVTNPNLSSTILRCVAQGENAEMIKREIKHDDLVEVNGYLRNEKDGKQILIKVLDFKKLDPDFKVDNKYDANYVQLIGKIITDLQDQRDNRNPEVLSFKLDVPREGNKSPLFFCRVHGQELIAEVKKNLKKGDIIFLKGDSVKAFSSLDNLICVFKEVKEIDYRIEYVDYKDTIVLRRFINRQGRINHHQYTQLVAKTQRRVTNAIKRARQMALLPYMIVEQNEEIPNNSKGENSGYTKGAYGGRNFGDYQAGGYGGHYSGTHASENWAQCAWCYDQ
ncbi:13929_t:CDS:2 [Entrophospora sp. SA101]|nr:15461_t:CDS:2 [Entrophospora sp. SA101]CAJ0865663.1 13929_t:CDS:2 [Entrophospora sp. SA101]